MSRTARLGGMVAGQGLRWAGTRLANRGREPEEASAALDARALRTADELVTQLGQMKGAAMKLGQVLSTVDFDLVPEGERDAFKRKLAALRDSAPTVPFARMRGLVESELGGPLDEHFAAFDATPVAAASIGQVHRARTHDGRDVAVKVQYPGVAEAVETDLRNLGVLLPLVRRLAPGLDAKAIAAELRDRVGEELDYELEAQNQRAVARAFRGHPHVLVPDVDTALSTRRVLVTDFVEGLGFEAVKALPQADRDRFGEIVFRFFFGLLARERRAAGDPHPGNLLLCADGRVGFLDFGLMRVVPRAYLDGEMALVRAFVAGDAGATHALMGRLGYLPDPDSFAPEAILDQMRVAGAWYLRPGRHRLDPEAIRAAMEASSSPRSEHFALMRRQTIPPEALLIRRMEGLVFAAMGELRVAADWAALAAEYHSDAPSSTPLGDEERAWLAGSVACSP